LPSYAVPSTITLVPTLPVSPSGKTDYARLVTAASAGTRSAAPHASGLAEADEITGWLVSQWRNLLDDPGIQPDSNLFLAGGQSLLAISISEQVRKRYDVDLPDLAIFENPTPRELAALVKRRQASATAAQAEEGR
jgi:acyl carrier protein